MLTTRQSAFVQRDVADGRDFEALRNKVGRNVIDMATHTHTR